MQGSRKAYPQIILSPLPFQLAFEYFITIKRLLQVNARNFQRLKQARGI